MAMPSCQHHTTATTTASTTHHRLEGQLAKETGWDWLTAVRKLLAPHLLATHNHQRQRRSRPPNPFDPNTRNTISTPSSRRRDRRQRSRRWFALALACADSPRPRRRFQDLRTEWLANSRMGWAWRDIRGGCEGAYVDDALAPQGANILLPPTTTHSTPREASFGAGGRCQLPATHHPQPRPASALLNPHGRVKHRSQDNDDGARHSLTPSTSIAGPSDGPSQPEIRWRAWDVRRGRKRARYGARPRIRRARTHRLPPPDACAHLSPHCSTHRPPTSPPSRGPCPSASIVLDGAVPCGKDGSDRQQGQHGFLGTYQTRSRTDRREGWQDAARVDCKCERAFDVRTDEADSSTTNDDAATDDARCGCQTASERTDGG
ncbi:hypothetical protein BJ912DRAFT_1138367 [Pholiota molesta]|nr:hypothetical protein BJ912DRAFT_1138367 [Pholiota molesta]